MLHKGALVQSGSIMVAESERRTGNSYLICKEIQEIEENKRNLLLTGPESDPGAGLRQAAQALSKRFTATSRCSRGCSLV